MNKKRIELTKFLPLVFIAIFLNSLSLLNAMPPKPGVFKDDFVSGEKTNISRQKSAYNTQSQINSSLSAIYINSTIKPLIVLVEFPDVKFSSPTPSGYENWLFAKTGKSLYTFYTENSGGKLSVNDGGVYPTIITADWNMSVYATDRTTFAAEVAEKLVKSGFDLSNFDANNDGIVDALIIIHAGNAQESTGKSTDIWSFKDSMNYSYPAITPYKIVDYMVLAETSPLGTFCHEFGHILGLPDLYNTLSGNSTCGKWDLMDAGGWTDDGNTPSHLSAWCKKYLGWGNENIIEEKMSNLKITPTETIDNYSDNNEFYKINIFGNSKEYFLLEYRNQTGFDSQLPDKGMLVWHIDETLLDSRLDSNKINTGSPHNSIDLITADGTIAGYSEDRVSATHLFRTGNVFDYPFNKSFDGVNSNISLSNFESNIDYMNFSASVLKSAEKVTVLQFFNYPNPTYNSKTTFKLELNKQIIKNTEFKIYDLSGKLVYKRNITYLDLISSTDLSFVYRFDWDCMDTKNNKVASGVYIYFVNSENVKKTGKLAVLN